MFQREIEVDRIRKPNIEIVDDVISIHFWDYTIEINIEEDKLYFVCQGERRRILTTNIKKEYDLKTKKDRNNDLEHKRFLTHWVKGQVLVGDVGHDGRIFFMVFTQDAYRHYRGKPFWIVSYFNNRHRKQKQFFVSDMKEPVRVWNNLNELGGGINDTNPIRERSY